MIRSTPPDRDPLKGARANPVSFNAPGMPPGEDGLKARTFNSATDEIENVAERHVSEPDGDDQPLDGVDFLKLVRDAEQQALLYVQQINRKAWSQSLRAFHQEHYIGSKYTTTEYRGGTRSKLFVPKTRAAVRKDNAAVAASLFNSVDAINCSPGNEADPKQRGAAAVMQELVNYRTTRTSDKAGFPWFLVAMGSRQDAMLTGVCCSKQSWKQEHRKVKEEAVSLADENGVYVEKKRDVFALEIDRPDMMLIPPENYVIDPGASWLAPVQSAAFFIIKWPMQVEEIKAKQNAPVNPWNDIPEEVLKGSVESGKFDMEAIRRAREMGQDRLNETQTGTHFQIVWVYECFIKVDGEDYTFYSVGDKTYLTDPRPTREVYPAHFGERPIALGYGNLESHRIYPMSPVESWQPLQLEVNDLRNLMLDAVKQNVMPISKVRRGKQIDLDQVKRRSSGSSILVSNPDDVTWETPPQVPQSAVMMTRELDLELDDLAGQQNYGSVETNNALGKTLGGLKLAAGAANAVQEFDIRVWIETWAQPALAQIVQLEQYYESDPHVLGIVGQKAQLFEKYGINQIDDDLLEQQITVRVSIGLGAGDPQQRLAKFSTAAQIIAPIIQQSPEFQSGQREINIEAIIEEVFGAAGYKDGGTRFFKENKSPRPNPVADLKTKELQARIAKDERTGQAQYFTGLAALAKVALGKRELEADVVDQMLARQLDAKRLGFEHGHKHNEQHLSATDHGHRHGIALAQHRQTQNAGANANGGGAEMDNAAATPTAPPPSEAGLPDQPSASPPTTQPNGAAPLPPMMSGAGSGGQPMAPGTEVSFTRDRNGRIIGARLLPGAPVPSASPAAPSAPTPPPAPQAHAPAAPAPVAAPAPKSDPMEERLARLEAIAERMAKPRSRRIVRDGNNRIVRVEED